jgi:acetyl esterase/lipase
LREVTRQEFKEIYFRLGGGEAAGWGLEYWNRFFVERNWTRSECEAGDCVTRSLAVAALVASLGHVELLRAQAGDPVPSLTRVYREVGGASLRAYVFLPPGRREGEGASAILLFHGGGWSTGSPVWTFPAARRFADSGLVAVAIEYRLSVGSVTPMDALADACAAFGWIRTHGADFGVTGRVAGYGVSAGGHLAAATVTIGCSDNRVGPEALLLWSPALDPAGDGWFARLLRGRASAPDLSPARHVGRYTPATSIVHGERDALTPLAGARRYCAALTVLGRRCDLHVYPDVGHLLTRNLANQEDNYDPDPSARADGIARHHRFLRSLGFVGR